jgi:hypothetical protein
MFSRFCSSSDRMFQSHSAHRVFPPGSLLPHLFLWLQNLCHTLIPMWYTSNGVCFFKMFIVYIVCLITSGTSSLKLWDSWTRKQEKYKCCIVRVVFLSLWALISGVVLSTLAAKWFHKALQQLPSSLTWTTLKIQLVQAVSLRNLL